jgi:glycosyltransferase involved in cell wall biosynthesis
VRIAIITRNARVVGGVESYLKTAIPLLEATGHEISLFCERDAPSTAQSISCSTNRATWCVTELGVQRAFESLRRWRPELIYSHGLADLETETQVLSLAPAMVFAHDYRAVCISGRKAFALPTTKPCARQLGPGCVMNFYPRRCGGLNPLTMLTDFRRAAQRLALLRSARAVLTASNYVRAEYVRNGLSPQAVRCVGCPIVDHGEIPAGISDQGGASAATPLRLLFAGRMEAVKGGRILLDALPSVASALARPLVLTFAGDGAARLEWARRADAVVRDCPALRVEFTGWISSTAVTSLFDSSDLLVVPSLWPEPFGLVGPEAGIRGLPAAAFATGGIPEWLTDGVNGALAASVSLAPEDLGNAIVRCLRDPTEYARMRRGAIELAKRFSPERHLGVLTEVIGEISQQAAPLRPEPAARDSATTALSCHNE